MGACLSSTFRVQGDFALGATIGEALPPLPSRLTGPDPSKMAKRRHQIGSLYHYAKQKELEQLEQRSQGAKSKAETQRKYGW